jgi:hypothetical protein
MNDEPHGSGSFSWAVSDDSLTAEDITRYRQAERFSWQCPECQQTIHGPDGRSTDHEPDCSLHPTDDRP